MGPVIIVWVLGLALLVLGVYLSCKNGLDSFKGYLSSVIGLFFLVIVTFVGVPEEISVGLPARSIVNGEYKVAFVYMAGENVNLGIEKKSDPNDKESKERLYLYQFPKSAFGSESINIQARKLVVMESGKFRKLVLK